MNRATRQIEKYLIDSGADPAKISAASSLLTWYWKKSRFFIAMPRCVIVTWQNKIWFNKDKKEKFQKGQKMRNNTLGRTLAALIWQKREPYEMNISGQYFFHVNSSICSISLGNPFVHIPLDDAQWSA